MFQDLTSLVINVGTYSSKIGYGGDDAPKIMTPSYLGKCPSEMIPEDGSNVNRYLTGQKFLSINRPDLQIEPLYRNLAENKFELDFNKYQAFLAGHLYDSMHVNLPDYSVLLSEDMSQQPHQLRQSRTKIAQIMFEKFKVPNIYFCKIPVLSCFATGRSTALVLDSGQNFTRAVSVHDGYALYKSAKCYGIGGKTISQEVKETVEKMSGPLKTRYTLEDANQTSSFQQYHMKDLLRDIKEHLSVKNNEENVQETIKVEYQLPDRQSIVVDKEQIIDPFINVGNFQKKHPQTDVTYRGLPTMVVESINSCDVDIKKELYSNILMTGGNMLYGNLLRQVENKVAEMAPPNVKVKGVAMCMPAERKYSEWIGGSIVTSLSSFQSYWVGYQEWKEAGVSIIEKKCT